MSPSAFPLLRCLLICVAVHGLVAGAGAAPGARDKSFSSDGISIIPINGRAEYLQGMALQASGRVVVVGGYDSTKRDEWFVGGVESGGARDTVFGFRYVGAPGTKDDAVAEAVALQSSGAIVVAGRIHNGMDYDAAVARFLSSGQIDTSFGAGGVLTIPLVAGDERLNAVAIDKFDRIVLGGVATGLNGSRDFAVVRLTAAGLLDTSFNTTGKVITPVTTGDDILNAITTTSDATVVAVGSAAAQGFAAVRYLENGTLDSSFDGDGIAIVSFGAPAVPRGVALRSDGAVVMVGGTAVNTTPVVALARLAANGTPDPDFGTAGKVTTSIGGGARANAVALAADDKIVVAGAASLANDDFLVLRYEANGALDLGFQGTGFVTTNLGPGEDEAFSVVIQPDGKILAGGSSFRGFDGDGFVNADLALVRYLGGNGLPPAIPISATELSAAVTGDANSIFSAFKTPQSGAFAGSFKTGGKATPAIFAADGSVRVKVGGEAPGLGGSVITKLGEPSGQAALATLKAKTGPVVASNRAVLLGGLTTGPARIAAREGEPNAGLPAGVTIKSFGTIDGNGTVIFFLATLQGTGITPQTDAALCAALADGTVKILVREGDPVGGKTVATIGTLVAVKGTLAEGRWRIIGDSIGVRLSFPDKSQTLFSIPSTTTSSSDWERWISTGDALLAPFDGLRIATFGMPAYGGAGPVIPVTFVVGEGSVTKADDAALMRFTSFGVFLFAREGGAVPDAAGASLPGVTYKSIGDAVSGPHLRAAWTAKLSGPSKDEGVWWVDGGGTTRQLTRVGGDAPGGGQWAKFLSLAHPDGGVRGPLLHATLAANKAAEIASGTTGLWGVNAMGELKLIVRTGQFVRVGDTARVLSKFTALTPAPGALGAASGYDDAGTISILATFTDKTTALLRLALP